MRLTRTTPIRPLEPLRFRVRHHILVREDSCDDCEDVCEKATKTGRHRTVRLLPSLRRDLVAWRLAPGTRTTPTSTGRAPRGLDGVTPYSLRHAFASLLVKSGLNVVEIAAQLGHGPGVTLSTYAHLLDSLGDGRVEADAEIRRARKGVLDVA